MIVAIVRLRKTTVVDEVIQALIAAGISHAEVTLPTPGSLELIKRWSKSDRISIGAGTVRSVADASAAAEAGARFFVTPTIDKGVLDIALNRGIKAYPGALTPTEIETAYRHPATAGVKVFPVGTVGGPNYVKAIKDPLPDIPLVPTGGVDVAATQTYAQLGCLGVGVGSALVSEEVVVQERWGDLTIQGKAFVDAWSEGVDA